MKSLRERLLAGTLLIAGIAEFLNHIDDIKKFFTHDPDVPPKVRIQYFDVKGYAISYLLQGFLDENLQKSLGGKPVVSKNMVFKQIEKLQSEYGEPPSEPLLSNELDESGLSKLPRSTYIMPFSIGRSYDITDDEFISNVFLGNPLRGADWSVAFNRGLTKNEISSSIKSKKIPVDYITFTKKLSCKELDYPATELLKRIDSENCLGMKFEVTAQYDQSCSDGWNGIVNIPGLSLELLILSNISDKPIKIDKIKYSSVNANGSNVFKDSQAAPQSDIVGDGTLLPSERLVIPIGLRFSQDSTQEGITEVFSQEEIRLNDIQINKGQDVNLEVYSSNENVRQTVGRIGLGDLKERYTKQEHTKNDGLPYIGTKLAIQSIDVDGVSQEVHPIRLGSMYISESVPGASCPYVTLVDKDGSKTSIGKTLVSRDNKSKQGWDVISLKEWPDSIIIEERDAETTYLKDIYLVCEHHNGIVETRKPVNPIKSDSDLKIDQGKDHAFQFDPLGIDMPCDSISMRINGYYVPK